jgi:hypothetical protein
VERVGLAGPAGHRGREDRPACRRGTDEVVVADSTSVNLFKLLVARPGCGPNRRGHRDRADDVPLPTATSRRAPPGLLGLELRWCDPLDPLASVDQDTAVLALTHVDFRTGSMYDLPGITAAAQAKGALVLWDLCHTTGAVPVDLGAVRGGPGGGLHLQVPQRRPRRSGVRLRGSASCTTSSTSRSPAGSATPSRSRWSGITGRRRG